VRRVGRIRVLTRRERNRAVLARQLLLERSSLPLPKVLERVAGIQAQYAPSMYVGLWSRTEGLSRDVLTRALTRRTVVQGTLLRGTIHLVSARDYWPFELAVRDDRRDWWMRSQRPRPDLAAVQAAADRLAGRLGDTALHRRELPAVVGAENASGLGLCVSLVRVPPSGTWERRRADLFGLATAWVGAPTVTPDEGRARLVSAYLRAFGPATRKDIATFCGLPVTRVQAVLDGLRLRRFASESGAELLDVPGAPLPPADTPAPVRFLPTWDSSLLTHCREAGVIEEADRPRIFHIRLPQSKPVFLVDGTAAGTWRYADGEVQLEPWRPLPPPVLAEVEAEAARLAEFHS
jgi:hypothetical protein